MSAGAREPSFREKHNKPKILHNALVFVGDCSCEMRATRHFPISGPRKSLRMKIRPATSRAPTGRGALPSPRQQAGEAQSSPPIGTKSKSIDLREKSLLRWSKWSAPAGLRLLSVV